MSSQVSTRLQEESQRDPGLCGNINMHRILNHLSEILLLFISCFKHFSAPHPFQLFVFHHCTASGVSITFVPLISLPWLPPSVFHPNLRLASWCVRVFCEAKRSVRWAVVCVQIICLLGRGSIYHNCLCVGPLMSKKHQSVGKRNRESTYLFTPAFLLVVACRFGGSGEKSGGAKPVAFPFPFKAPPKLL